MIKLELRLNALVEEQVLTPVQSAELADAAQADLSDALTAAGQPAPRPDEPSSARSPVLDVLGYAGGALLLGAVIFLGYSFWDELERPGRIGVALAAFGIPAIGGSALVAWKTRPEVGRVLLALACYAAGFAWTVITEDDKLVGTATVILVASAVGLILLRASTFLVSGWTGAMTLVGAVVANVIYERSSGPERLTEIPVQLTIGFMIVALIFTALGFMINKTLAWSLAGLSGWAAAISLQFMESSGQWWSLGVGTVVVVILFFGFIRIRRHALAVIGCLILLSLWPVSFYRITEDELGAALGLIAAGAVLIAAVVLRSRRPRITA